MSKTYSLSARPRAVVLFVAWAVVSFAFMANADQIEEGGNVEEPMTGSEALVRLWSHPGIFEQATQAELANGALYVSGTPRGLDVIDVLSGKSAWKHMGKSVIDQPPKVLGEVVYLVEGGQFVTLDRDSGDELSRSKTRIGTLTPIYPGAKDWIIGATNERVYGIIPETGIGKWRVTLSGKILDAAWDGSKVFYVRTAKGFLYAVSAQAESILWKHEMPRPDCSQFALDNSTLYIGCSDYYLYSLDTESGEVQWRICLNAPVFGKPVVVGSRVYVSTDDGVLHAVDTSTNTVAWTLADAERILTTTDTRVIFLRRPDAQGRYSIGIADAATGEALATVTARRFQHFAAATTGGVFYAVAENGDVLAIADRETAERIRKAAETSAAE